MGEKKETAGRTSVGMEKCCSIMMVFLHFGLAKNNDGNGVVDPGEDYLAFRIWEEINGIEEYGEETDDFEEEEVWMLGELFVLGVLIYWLATDTSTALWVIGGFIALAVVLAMMSGGKGKKQHYYSAPAGNSRIRIDHPHLLARDDYECSICGRRFSGNQMSCPSCGVRFTGTKEDLDEWYEEEDEWEAWDEEDEL